MRLTLSESPRALFTGLVVMIVMVLSVGTYVTLRTTASLEETADNASGEAELAQLAAEASDRLRQMSQITRARIDEALQSPQITSLTATQQEAVAEWVGGQSDEPPTASVAALPAALSLNDAVEFQSALEYLTGRLSALISGVAPPNLEAVSQQAGAALERSIDDYYAEPTLARLRDLELGLKSMQTFTANQVPRLSAEALTLREDLKASVRFLRGTVILLGLTGGSTVLALGFFMTRTTQRMLVAARQEQAEMAELTRNLEYRNNQLNALYNVFNEITDTLSLRYVVKATMFESLKIMRADMVVLRILRGNELEVVGAMTAGETQIEGLPAVPLGEGPTGRTAKRGRTLRIDEGGERMMAPPDAEEDASGAPSKQGRLGARLESGLIVPLIVGARVVGTISCWSRERYAYSDSDERILEMMASQVATAIVAADTTEKSEIRAMHDPLTSLPNRRQLDKDIEGCLADLVRDNGQALVAMIDIDHFKRFNDNYGHKVGDVTLQKVAAVLRSSARDNDHVYRYGGEEFVVVFTDSRPEDALALANRLRLAVEAAPLSGEHLDPVGPVTVSIGVAMMPQHGTDMNELLDKADKAMYRAKASGRNCVEVWRGEEPGEELSTVA